MCLVSVFLGVLGGTWVCEFDVCVFCRGGGVTVLGCVSCVVLFLPCVDTLVGEVGSRVDKLRLYVSV